MTDTDAADFSFHNFILPLSNPSGSGVVNKYDEVHMLLSVLFLFPLFQKK